MVTRWILVTAAAGSLVIGACGGGDSEAPPAPAPTATQPSTGVAAAQAPVAQAPAMLALGAAPSNITVPQPPSLNFTVAARAEYQIDVTGAGMDAELYLYSGDRMVARDSDGGNRLDAQLIRVLEPGQYQVRVQEHRARPFSGQVRLQQLPPMAPAGIANIGAPVTVAVPPAGSLGTRTNRSKWDATRAVTLNIATPGRYQCDAHGATATGEGMDAQMSLNQNLNEIVRNSDGGEGTDARITRDLQPGSYVLRVWEWRGRAANITVTCIPAS